MWITGKGKPGAADPHAGRRWITATKRLGLAGFCFFFVKGLLWLIVPALVIQGCSAP